MQEFASFEVVLQLRDATNNDRCPSRINVNRLNDSVYVVPQLEDLCDEAK